VWKRHAERRRRKAGTVSPVLSKYYLHKLDDFVGNTLIPEYTRGENKNPEQRNMSECVKRMRGHGRKGDHRESAGTTQKAGLPAERGLRRPRLPQTPLRPVRRTTRFSGSPGRKPRAEEIKQTAGHVPAGRTPPGTVSRKTLITHARTGAAKFLDMRSPTQHSGTSGRKRINGGHSAARAHPGDQGQMRALPGTRQTRCPESPAETSAPTRSSRPTGRNTGASASTTCSPATSTD